jgi:hypothetical protein
LDGENYINWLLKQSIKDFSYSIYATAHSIYKYVNWINRMGVKNIKITHCDKERRCENWNQAIKSLYFYYKLNRMWVIFLWKREMQKIAENHSRYIIWVLFVRKSVCKYQKSLFYFTSKQKFFFGAFPLCSSVKRQNQMKLLGLKIENSHMKGFNIDFS